MSASRRHCHRQYFVRGRNVSGGQRPCARRYYKRTKKAAESTDSAFAKNSRIFHGWFVVAGGFAVTLVGFGCVYSFSAFVESLQREFGAFEPEGPVRVFFSVGQPFPIDRVIMEGRGLTALQFIA